MTVYFFTILSFSGSIISEYVPVEKKDWIFTPMVSPYCVWIIPLLTGHDKWCGQFEYLYCIHTKIAVKIPFLQLEVISRTFVSGLFCCCFHNGAFTEGCTVFSFTMEHSQIYTAVMPKLYQGIYFKFATHMNNICLWSLKLLFSHWKHRIIHRLEWCLAKRQLIIFRKFINIWGDRKDWCIWFLYHYLMLSCSSRA